MMRRKSRQKINEALISNPRAKESGQHAAHLSPYVDKWLLGVTKCGIVMAAATAGAIDKKRDPAQRPHALAPQ